MGSKETLSCPVPGCSRKGTLSRVIHHITEQDNESHTWQALGFQNSYDFRTAHNSDSDDNDEHPDSENAPTVSSGTTNKSIPLEEVPGIGSTRAEALRQHGYADADDVAAVSVQDLSQTPKIGKSTARCIHVTAQEECNYNNTFVSRLASSLDVDRSDVADAYGDLAACAVEPRDAEESLRVLFDGDDCSVMHLSEYAVRYRHFLRQAGFEDIDDVATATIDSLAEAAYIGESLAQNIRQSARHEVRFESTVPDESTSDNENAERSSDNSEKSLSEGTVESKQVKSDSQQTSDKGGTRAYSGHREGFPPELRDRDQWLLWKPTEDGRKIPRAPWVTSDPLQYVNGMDPGNWTNFSEALEWREKLPQNLHLAFVLTRDDEFAFVDLDDVVVDGTPSRQAQRLIDDAESYAAVSTSGTGIHIFGQGSLSQGIKSLTGPLDDAGNQTLEVYDRNRFVAMTGDHIEETPMGVASITSLLSNLEDEFATVSSSTPDRATTEPRQSREELRQIETTNDIQDLFDAINQTRPSDIRMQSTQTRKHGDGTYSYDPSWTHSKSGTRLGVLDDVWIYRKGMIALNALQVVALEEGIISDEREYPKGEAFWNAVEALRDRGAHIPNFEPDETTDDFSPSDDPTDEIDKWEIAKRINYGNPVRTYIHRFDRDYQEQLALDLTPMIAESAHSLQLSPAVTYRAAEVYAAGHAAGIVPGASHESTLGAAFRVASIEAGTPRPLQDIATSVDEPPKLIRQKFHRLIQETGISDAIDASDLIVNPIEYVPYLARELDVHEDKELCTSVRDLLRETSMDGGSNPMSEVAAAFYVVLKRSPDYQITQKEISDAAGMSEVTIRNNYRKFTNGMG